MCPSEDFTDLVAVSPEEIPRSDILIWVFDPLFQWRQLLPMFPVRVPQIPRVEAAQDQTRDDDAGNWLAIV